MSIRDRNVKLSQAFHFTSADLNLNKEGKIAESQQAKVEKFRRGRVISLAAFAVMGGLFLLGCLGVGVSTLFSSGDNTTRLAIMGALGVGLLAMGGGAANFYLRSRELLTGKLSSVEGPAEPIQREASVEDMGFGMAYFVKVAGKQFPLLNEEQYNSFEAGASHRIFYVKNYPLDVLLSVEAI